MKYKEIGYRITLAREEAGLNQKELAEMLGISQASLSNYENGKRRVYLPQLEIIASVLNKPLDYFSQPIDLEVKSPRAVEYDEVGELFQLIGELKDLPKEDRKSVLDYIRWLKSQKGGREV